MRILKTFFVLLLAACTTMKNSQKTALPAFDLEGHRGCRGLLPENTIPAMIKALDLGVTTLEMDVVITADSQVVLSHDPYFNHQISTKPNDAAVTEAEEKSLNIFQMPYSEVARYDVGRRGHPRFMGQQKMAAGKPLLADVIKAAEAHAAHTNRPAPFYNIETKSTAATDGIYHPAPETFVRLLMDVIESKNISPRVIIQSFDNRTLKILHAAYPQLKTSLLIDEGALLPLDGFLKNLGFLPTILSPHFSLVTPAFLQTCHQQKIKVVPWTVNDLPQMRHLKTMGVDGLISDFPNLFSLLD